MYSVSLVLATTCCYDKYILKNSYNILNWPDKESFSSHFTIFVIMGSVYDFMRILELKRYSKNTIESYHSHLKLAQSYFKDQSFKRISDEQWFEYIYYMVNVKKISMSYQRQIIGSIKLFYKEIYNRHIPFEYLKVTQFENKLPVVLSKQEVQKILAHTTNLKHKAILSLIYGSGLRVGELIELKKTDIDSDRMLVHVRNAKGKKDRYTVLSVRVLEILRSYYKKYKPKEYLFEGQKGGQYTTASSRQVFIKALKKAKINKQATLHTLRHSFATHLLESGVSIAHIQKLLGHSNIKTTLIYTHIAKDSLFEIKSPLDY